MNFFSETDVDIVSSEISHQLNDFLVIGNCHHDLGGNPKGSKFKMPMTFAFNRKALDLVLDIPNHYAFEDEMWRDIWVKNKLKHKIINNRDEVIWYVHGKNVSTSNLLIGIEPEKEYTIQITPIIPPKE